MAWKYRSVDTDQLYWGCSLPSMHEALGYILSIKGKLKRQNTIKLIIIFVLN